MEAANQYSGKSLSLILIGVCILIGSLMIIRDSNISKSCDLSNPINRSFDVYYGIRENYFQEVNGEKSKIPLYKSFIPEDLFSKNSFICVGGRGTGKTTLRKNYLKEKQMVIELFNPEVSHILNNFLSNVRIGENLNRIDHEIIELFWTPISFEHTVLYLFVEKILEFYNKNKNDLINTLKNISFDEKIQITLILNLYVSKEKLNTLNSLLTDIWNDNKKKYSEEERKIMESIEGEEINKKLKDSFLDLNKYYTEILVVQRDFDRIKMISNTIKEYDLNPVFKLQYDKLSIFTQFFKKYYNFTPIIAIDSLDEVNYFFDEKTIHKGALKQFVKSCFYSSILAKAFNGSIEIAYFFPQLESVDPKDFMERKDKIPMIYINWTQSQLKNYADYVLKVIETEQNNYCKKIKDFHGLINYDIAKFYVEQLKTPREINIFMQEFMLSLSGDSENYKFEPKTHNIAIALEKTMGRVNRIN
jgi:hypothetical protein